MNTFLVIDPGLKHTCALLVSVRQEGPDSEIWCEIHWATVVDLSGQVNPDKDKAQREMDWIWHSVGRQLEVKGLSLAKVVVEFQPPLNTRTNCALVRWNSWIEGFVVAFFSNKTWVNNAPAPVVYVHSSGVKRFFDISSGAHYVNKKLAIERAQCFVKDKSLIGSDHAADCVLMAIYEFKRARN